MKPNIIKWARLFTNQPDLSVISGLPRYLPSVIEFINDNATLTTVTFTSKSGSAVTFLMPPITQLMANMEPKAASFAGGAITAGWRGSPFGVVLNP